MLDTSRQRVSQFQRNVSYTQLELFSLMVIKWLLVLRYVLTRYNNLEKHNRSIFYACHISATRISVSKRLAVTENKKYYIQW
jgi:hypothetical protein